MENNNNNQVHVLPLKTYLGIGSILIFLTLVTVLVAQLDFGAWNLGIALGIASIKATLVLLYFMHLKYDNKLYSLLFGSALFILVIFIVITMFDTLRRDDIYAEKSGTIKEFAMIYDEAGKPFPKPEISEGGAATGNGLISAFELKNGFGPIKEEIQVGPIDMAMVHFAKPIFETKCASCHKMDKRSAGPPLRDVTKRRAPAFIMNQILNPDENVKKHPEGQKLLAEYYIYMTFQNVSKKDARALLEYLRWEAEQAPSE